MRIVPMLGGLCLAALLAGCAGSSVPKLRVSEDPAVIETARKAIAAAPVHQIALGSDGRPVGLDDKIVIRSPRLTGKLQEILNRVMLGWTETTPKPAIEVFLLADANYGGLARSGNQIFIELGTLMAAEHEDELAFILGHEAGHVALGHLSQRRQRQQGVYGGLGFAAEAVGFATAMANTDFSTTRQGELRSRTTLQQNDRNTIVAAAAGAQILASLYSEIGDSLFSREQETEADRFGLDRIARAGYSIDGVHRFFRIAAESERHKQEEAAQLRGKVSQAMQLAGLIGAQGGGQGGKWFGLGATLLGSAVEEGVAKAITPLTGRYDPMAQRLEDMHAYERAHWPKLAEEAEPRASPFAPGSALRAEVEGFAEAVAIGTRFDQALANGDLPAAAVEAASPALQRIPVLAAMIRARMAEAEGDLPRAQREAEQARRMPDASPEAYKLLVRILTAQKRFTQALAVLDDGQRTFNSREPFLVSRAGVLSRAQMKEPLQAVLVECDKVDPTIGRACQAAAKENRPEPAQAAPGQPAPAQTLPANAPMPANPLQGLGRILPLGL